MFLGKNKKNITICHLKIHIFTAITYRNILYGRVIVIDVKTASSLFPSNTWITSVVFFPLSREKVMVEPGTAIIVSVRLRSSFVTLLSTPYAFLQGSNLGFHVARLY